MDQSNPEGFQHRPACRYIRRAVRRYQVLAMEFIMAVRHFARSGRRAVCGGMEVDVAMRHTAVTVRMRMDDKTFRAVGLSQDKSRQVPSDVAEAQNDQYQRHSEFHRDSHVNRNGEFEEDYGGADGEHRGGMPQAPDRADAGRDTNPALPGQDRGDRYHVIGIGRMPHPQHQSEESDTERGGVGRADHNITFRRSRQSRGYPTRPRITPTTSPMST